MELYHRYRPNTFGKVIGCPDTVQSLEAYIAKGNTPHFMLFQGPSGCGKTTLARITAAGLGCSGMDLREMNSAQFRGIDTIREIQSKMNNAPAMSKCRVYIMDEVHQFRKDAQEAALKMLEDVPAHVYFIFCTTEPEALIPTLIGRATRFTVRAFGDEDMRTLIERVAKKESIKLAPKTTDVIIKAAGGSARVALVMLDKCATLPPDQHAAAIEEIIVSETEGIELCRALIKKRPWTEVARILEGLKGRDPEGIRRAVLGYARIVMLKEGNHQSYLVARCFERNFYDSGMAGLAIASFESVLIEND
jgi:DNA polymerase III subunit gamma/tau